MFFFFKFFQNQTQQFLFYVNINTMKCLTFVIYNLMILIFSQFLVLIQCLNFSIVWFKYFTYFFCDLILTKICNSNRQFHSPLYQDHLLLNICSKYHKNRQCISYKRTNIHFDKFRIS